MAAISALCWLAGWKSEIREATNSSFQANPPLIDIISQSLAKINFYSPRVLANTFRLLLSFHYHLNATLSRPSESKTNDYSSHRNEHGLSISARFSCWGSIINSSLFTTTTTTNRGTINLTWTNWRILSNFAYFPDAHPKSSDHESVSYR